MGPHFAHPLPERGRGVFNGAEYRGIVQYYLLAGDVWRFSRLRWVMLTSMLKTLAAKHRATVTKMARKYKTVVDTPHDREPASKPVLNERAGNHWSPGSVASTYDGSK